MICTRSTELKLVFIHLMKCTTHSFLGSFKCIFHYWRDHDSLHYYALSHLKELLRKGAMLIKIWFLSLLSFQLVYWYLWGHVFYILIGWSREGTNRKVVHISCWLCDQHWCIVILHQPIRDSKEGHKKIKHGSPFLA